MSSEDSTSNRTEPTVFRTMSNISSFVSLNAPVLPHVPMGYKRQMFNEDDIRVEIRNGQETMVYDPYNPVNVMITDREIQDILRTYGVQVPIQHFAFYRRALCTGRTRNRP